MPSPFEKVTSRRQWGISGRDEAIASRATPVVVGTPPMFVSESLGPQGERFRFFEISVWKTLQEQSGSIDPEIIQKNKALRMGRLRINHWGSCLINKLP
jgi:hypothetical protein